MLVFESNGIATLNTGRWAAFSMINVLFGEFWFFLYAYFTKSIGYNGYKGNYILEE